MKVSDYIVSFLIEKGVTDVFGYPGGMVTHLMDSLDKYASKISSHLAYNEQGASFAVCGFGQYKCTPSLAYGTSGPGATNMITGICDAYFDSIPALFIAGQVNTYESKKGFPIRQKGFQETEMISMVKDVTKYAVYVEKSEDIRYHLEKAWYMATKGRKGPVFLDIPMDVQRGDIDPAALKSFMPENMFKNRDSFFKIVPEIFKRSKKPCLLAGAGINSAGMREAFKELAYKANVPVVTSMIAVDLLNSEEDCNYGFLGVYGHRAANFILSQCDVILSLGSRLDGRQTGALLENFAPGAKLIRVDIDPAEFSRKVKEDEIQIAGDLRDIIPYLIKSLEQDDRPFFYEKDVENWREACRKARDILKGRDEREPNRIMEKISGFSSHFGVITSDVGQNQIWAAQSFKIMGNQRMLFSGGHGAMGYSLPAAIGAYYASGEKVLSLNGDGGLQMNIQELEFIAREKLPITVAVFNNRSLGMIRHFQEMYFDSNYVQTKAEKGYTSPDFAKIGLAYGLKSAAADCITAITSDLFAGNEPALIDIRIKGDTYVFPKLAYNKPCDDQEPPLDNETRMELNALIDILNGGG